MGVGGRGKAGYYPGIAEDLLKRKLSWDCGMWCGEAAGEVWRGDVGLRACGPHVRDGASPLRSR
jgi:hypothetical protein